MIWTSEYMSPLGRITLACDDEAIVVYGSTGSGISAVFCQK